MNAPFRRHTALLLSRRAVVQHIGYFDLDLYMGHDLMTDCPDCEGTGYLRAGQSAFGDEVGAQCCPHCNLHGVLPRDACACSDAECIRIGTAVHVRRCSTRRPRRARWTQYVCPACLEDLLMEGMGVEAMPDDLP